MGLSEVLKNAAVTALNAVGNIATVATYHSTGVFTVSPATGNITESGDTDQSTITMLFSDYTSDEIDGVSILSTDQKISIPSNSLTATPKVDDYVLDSSIKWHIQRVGIDPAGAMWVLQGRKKE